MSDGRGVRADGDGAEEIERTIIEPGAAAPVPAERPPAGSSTRAGAGSGADRTLVDADAGDRTLVSTPGDPAPGLPRIPGVTLTRELGRGGMGVVYEGKQGYLDRTVAVKLLATKSRGGEFEKRFRREAKILAGLTHPNIVACYQAGVTDESECYFVMEFIDGPSLRQWIDKNGAVPMAHALALCRDVARALGHASDAGIIHRDVKPENVLLQRDERVKPGHPFPFHAKLADLGLARPETGETTEMNLTIQGSVMGTPATMAPEQFDDPDHVDFRADLYGLGCVLYHAVTGSVAYPQRTISETIAKKMASSPPDPRKVKREIPKGVGDLVTQMLARKREDRPASYAVVIDRCEVLAREFGPAPALARRNRTWLFAGAGVGAVAVAAGIFVLGGGSKDPPKEDDERKDAPAVIPAPAPDPKPPVVDPRPPRARPALLARIEGGKSDIADGETIELTAAVSGDDGEELEYEWSVESRPPVGDLAGSTTKTLKLQAPAADQSYELRVSLAVGSKDGRAIEAPVRTIGVRVRPGPIASAAVPDKMEAGEKARLVGTNGPSDSPIRQWEWKLLGPGTLADPKAQATVFEAVEAAEFYDTSLELRVHDGARWSAPVVKTIHVDANPAMRPLARGERVDLSARAAWSPPKQPNATLDTHSENREVLVLSSGPGAPFSMPLRRGSWELHGRMSISTPLPKLPPPSAELRFEQGTGTCQTIRLVTRGARVTLEITDGHKEKQQVVRTEEWAADRPLEFEVRWDQPTLTLTIDPKTKSGSAAKPGTLVSRPRSLSIFAMGGGAEFGALELVGL